MADDLKGRFMWYELLTTAPDAAQDFYTKVVGWGTSVWDGAGQPYQMWTVGESAIGGLMQLPEEAAAHGAPPHWMTHIGSPDLDQSLKRLEQLGGSLLKDPMEVPEVGRFGIVADPHGAVFSIYTPAGEIPVPEGFPRVGDISWNELVSGNWKEAFDFYQGLFGWEKGPEHDMGEMGVYQIYQRGGVPIGGMFDKPPDMPACWIFYARVPDVKAKVDPIRSAGGAILNGPMEVPGGDWILQFSDPQGAVFALHSLNPNR